MDSESGKTPEMKDDDLTADREVPTLSRDGAEDTPAAEEPEADEFWDGPEDDLTYEERDELAAAIEADRHAPVSDDDFVGPEGLGSPYDC